MSFPLPVQDGLQRSSRLSGWIFPAKQIRWWEMGILLGSGAFATFAVAKLEFIRHLPGHAILRAVLPMGLGLAAVPRRGAGTVMGMGAAGAIAWLWLLYHPVPGWGATTSLLMLGPMLDAALWKKATGWRVWLRFSLAGLAANLVAFAMRGGGKLAGLHGGGRRSLGDWYLQARWTYPLCGLIAGGIAAAIWFRWRARDDSPADRSDLL